jgi:hypothetical protein
VCHDSHQRWFLFLFGRRSALVVTGLLAATDPFSFSVGFVLLVSPVSCLGLVGLLKPVMPDGLFPLFVFVVVRFSCFSPVWLGPVFGPVFVMCLVFWRDRFPAAE